MGLFTKEDPGEVVDEPISDFSYLTNAEMPANEHPTIADHIAGLSTVGIGPKERGIEFQIINQRLGVSPNSLSRDPYKKLQVTRAAAVRAINFSSKPTAITELAIEAAVAELDDPQSVSIDTILEANGLISS